MIIAFCNIQYDPPTLITKGEAVELTHTPMWASNLQQLGWTLKTKKKLLKELLCEKISKFKVCRTYNHLFCGFPLVEVCQWRIIALSDISQQNHWHDTSNGEWTYQSCMTKKTGDILETHISVMRDQSLLCCVNANFCHVNFLFGTINGYCIVCCSFICQNWPMEQSNSN